MGYEKNNCVVIRCDDCCWNSQKLISEDEAIQIARDDLDVSEKDEHSVIIGNRSYDEEKQEYQFYLHESEEKSYGYVIDATSGEIKQKNKI